MFGKPYDRRRFLEFGASALGLGLVDILGARARAAESTPAGAT